MNSCKNCNVKLDIIRCIPTYTYNCKCDGNGVRLPGEYKKKADSFSVTIELICSKCRFLHPIPFENRFILKGMIF